MNGIAGGKYGELWFASHLVVKAHRRSADFRNVDINGQEIVVLRASFVVAVSGDHWQTKARRFQLRIISASRTKVLGSTEFEVPQIVRVVDDAHLVGVAVDDSKRGLNVVMLNHGTAGIRKIRADQLDDYNGYGALTGT